MSSPWRIVMREMVHMWLNSQLSRLPSLLAANQIKQQYANKIHCSQIALWVCVSILSSLISPALNNFH